MKKYSALFLTLIIFLIPFISVAQENTVEMDDALRANGKIYIVVAVLSVILFLLFVFLISIDRKVRRLENEHRKR